MIHFRWPVFKGGYKFVPVSQKDGVPLSSRHNPADEFPNLVLKRTIAKRTERGFDDRYPLDDHSCLFQTFAKMRIHQDDIEKFTSKYGPLGLRDTQGNLLIKTTGEPFRAWQEAIKDMRTAISCWAKFLKPQKMKWVTPEFSSFDPHGSDDLKKLNREALWLAFKSLYSYDPPISREINIPDNDEHATMLYLIKKYLKDHTTNDMDWDPDRMEFKFRVVPSNLLGGIWTQFAFAVHEFKKYRPCANCRVWFELSPGIARTNRIYCSEACRLRLYRRKKKLEADSNNSKKNKQ